MFERLKCKNYKFYSHGFNETQINPTTWRYVLKDFLMIHEKWMHIQSKLFMEWLFGWDKIEETCNRLIEMGVCNTFEEAMELGWDEDGFPEEKKVYNKADWIELLSNESIKEINRTTNTKYVEGYVYREGLKSKIGLRFKQKPNWKITFERR